MTETGAVAEILTDLAAHGVHLSRIDAGHAGAGFAEEKLPLAGADQHVEATDRGPQVDMPDDTELLEPFEVSVGRARFELGERRSPRSR